MLNPTKVIIGQLMGSIKKVALDFDESATELFIDYQMKGDYEKIEVYINGKLTSISFPSNAIQLFSEQLKIQVAQNTGEIVESVESLCIMFDFETSKIALIMEYNNGLSINHVI